MSDIVLIAPNVGSYTLNGDGGVGFYRARINYDPEIAAESAEEILGISKWWENDSTVSKVILDLVIVM